MANPVYNLLFKKTSTFAFCTVMAAFVIETVFNVGTDAIYYSVNRGRLWENIKDNYKKAEQ